MKLNLTDLATYSPGTVPGKDLGAMKHSSSGGEGVQSRVWTAGSSHLSPGTCHLRTARRSSRVLRAGLPQANKDGGVSGRVESSERTCEQPLSRVGDFIQSGPDLFGHRSGHLSSLSVGQRAGGTVTLTLGAPARSSRRLERGMQGRNAAEEGKLTPQGAPG